MGNIERYRARLGRVMDDGEGSKGIAIVIADCGLHTHAAKIARALNNYEGAVEAGNALARAASDAIRIGYPKQSRGMKADALRRLSEAQAAWRHAAGGQ